MDVVAGPYTMPAGVSAKQPPYCQPKKSDWPMGGCVGVQGSGTVEVAAADADVVLDGVTVGMIVMERLEELEELELGLILRLVLKLVSKLGLELVLGLVLEG